jgi:photosystem II stability/assembly factor-like uncharacterized protein
MKNWMKVACLAMGTGLAFGSMAQGTGPARAGTVVEIRPDRIYLLNVARAGDRLVSVGERGFALLSDDGGKTWRAVVTPVTRTLTGVAFENARLGIAVGHGGSLVRTEDGGDTWASVDIENDAGSDSLLGVTSLGGGRFAAYGAFGLYLDSSDGGATWQRRQVISEEFENHISQVLPFNGALWMVAEYGTLARSEDGGATWTELESPYDGSFFGAIDAGDGVMVIFGMRGRVFRTADGGTTWQQIETGTTTAFNGGKRLSDGRILLVGNSGLVAESTDGGATFAAKWSSAGRGFSALAEVDGGGIVAVGESGAGLLDLAALTTR